MYKCKECDYIFEKPSEEPIESFEGVIGLFADGYGEFVYTCPNCNSVSLGYVEDEEPDYHSIYEDFKLEQEYLEKFID